MENFSVFAIALLVIFTSSVSEVKSLCDPVFSPCVSNNSCCSNNCAYSLMRDAFLCLPALNEENLVKEDEKVQEGQCKYKKLSDEESSGRLTEKYGSFYANHPLMPVDTKLNVTNAVNGRSIVVTISSVKPNSTNATLELSEEAAMALGMWDENAVPCRLRVEPHKTSLIVKFLKPLAVVVIYLVAVVASSFW